MAKNILIFFISLSPKKYKKNILKSRERDYLTSIRQTKRFLENRNWEVIYCENTIGDIEKLKHTRLWAELGDQKILMLKNNAGHTNKGIGELDMMISAANQYKKIFNQADQVSYFSGRRIMANPYLIEKSENLKSSALISNPDFLYVGGTYTPVEKNGMYNDMFFTMKKEVFYKYAEYTRELLPSLSNNKIIGSEQLLFQFINKYNIDYEWLPALGVIRRETYKKGLFTSNRWHIC
jgi:hypothetical protein